jgi:hypothetical protein
MSDLISRADAIETVCRTRCGDKAKGCPAHSCLVIEEFESLQSAETHEIRTETHSVCLISKDDAIEAVAQQWLFEASAESPYVNDDDIDDYRKLAEELLSDIPSAEAVQGEWRTGKPTENGEYMVTLDAWGHRYIDVMHYAKPQMPNREVWHLK